jgi:hypothetical protein
MGADRAKKTFLRYTMRSAIILLTTSAAVLAVPTPVSVQNRAVPDIRVELKDGFAPPIVHRTLPDITEIISDLTRIISRDDSAKGA